MALSDTESVVAGFVRSTDGALATTSSPTGTQIDRGFLRDADGRLVTTNV